MPTTARFLCIEGNYAWENADCEFKLASGRKVAVWGFVQYLIHSHFPPRSLCLIQIYFNVNSILFLIKCSKRGEMKTQLKPQAGNRSGQKPDLI